MEHKDYTDADICEVDLYVKSRLVTDTIKLAKKPRDKLEEIDEFGSLTKIHPCDAGEEAMTDIYTLVHNLRTIFYTITPIKSKTQVTAQMFEKLYKKKVISTSGMQKIDMSLAFQ